MDTLGERKRRSAGLRAWPFPPNKLEEVTNQIAARVALIPTDLIPLTKEAINHAYEIMGFRAALEYAAEIHDLSHTVPSVKQFFEPGGKRASGRPWREGMGILVICELPVRRAKGGEKRSDSQSRSKTREKSHNGN